MLKGEDIHLRPMKPIVQGQLGRKILILRMLVIFSVIRDAHIKQILTTVSIISVTPGKYSEE